MSQLMTHAADSCRVQSPCVPMSYTVSGQCWQNPRRSGWPEASSDEVGQVWNGGLVWDGEPGAGVVPERHTKLLAGFHQAQERVPAIPAHVAAGSAADLAPGHLGPDVVL